MDTIRFLQRLIVPAMVLAGSVGCSSRCCTSKCNPGAGPTVRVLSVKPVPCCPNTYVVKPGKTSRMPTKWNEQPTARPAKTSPQTGPVRTVAPSQLPDEFEVSSQPTPSPEAPVIRDESKPEKRAAVSPFCRSPDYSWVIGQLRYLHTRRCWQIRFAPINVEDRYGGGFCLTGIDHLSEHLKDGMLVKVEGVVINPDRRTPSPTYWVNQVLTLH